MKNLFNSNLNTAERNQFAFGPKIFLHRWINYKANNPNEIQQYGKLSFEYFVFRNASLVYAYQLDNIKKMFPNYFI